MDTDRKAYSVREFCARNGICRQTFYDEILARPSARAQAGQEDDCDRRERAGMAGNAAAPQARGERRQDRASIPIRKRPRAVAAAVKETKCGLT